jgi:hypothetical protein
VFYFAQTRRHRRAESYYGTRGDGELPVNDAQRYRQNAVKCLSAAERSEPPYRRLAFTIAAYWLALAREEEAMHQLLVIEQRSHLGNSALA